MNIITNAKSQNRKRGEHYYESHHILPKSLYPLWSNNKHNLVLLTAREHFVCHLLLTKIFPSYQMNLAYCRLALECTKPSTSLGRKMQLTEVKDAQIN